MKLLVLNGPNLNMLGIREPDIYGKETYPQLVKLVEDTCAELGVEVEVYQSNHEGDLVDKIQAAYGAKDAIVINPAAYTHTSVAILDALKAVNLPAVEVHISDVSQREDFRQVSYAGMACVQTYMGLGLEGYRKAILFLTFGISTGMVIWVGDPNLLYVFPLFVFFSMLSTQGDWMGRLAVTIIFFCIIMSVCAILDTYIALFDLFTIDTSDFLCRLMRPLFFALLYLLIRRRMPVGVISLSRRLWKLILGLSFMPLCALMAVVLLTYRKWDSMVANSLAMNQGMVVLPFTGVTALILLFVILTLANHEKLEQEVHLAGLREVYYQGIQREQVQVRTLRHDLRNHMTVLRGLLESGETEKAIGYLEQITDSSSLGGGKPFSDNETANVVLTAKAKEMRQRGIQGEFQISLPRNLLIAEMDLCALLGNALDNAMEAAEKSTDKTVRVRCRAEKGLFMLQVDNALAGDEKPDLSTTKKDKTAHGFGLLGMREIAKRYGGSFEVVAANGRFELVVCLPL